MTFRERLLATLRAVEPILEVRGVLVAGSEAAGAPRQREIRMSPAADRHATRS